MAKINSITTNYNDSELIMLLSSVTSRINVTLGTKKGLNNDSINDEVKVYSSQAFQNPVIISSDEIVIKNKDIKDMNLCCIETSDIKQIEVTCDQYDDGSEFYVIYVFCKSNDLVYRLSFSIV